jgi:phosphoribosylformylglycinamidine synthase
MEVQRLYAAAPERVPQVLLAVLQGVEPRVAAVNVELCFNVALSAPLRPEQRQRLGWLLVQPGSVLHDQPTVVEKTASDKAQDAADMVVEVGPRLHVSTPFSTNAVAICQAVGLTQVGEAVSARASTLHDPMLQ